MRRFDLVTLPGVLGVAALSVLMAVLNVRGAWTLYGGTDLGEVLVAVFVLCEILAFTFGLYMVWRWRNAKGAAAALFVAFVVLEAVNAFGGKMAFDLERRPIEEKWRVEDERAWEAANAVLQRQRYALNSEVQRLYNMLPQQCAGDSAVQTACQDRYDRSFAKAQLLNVPQDFKDAQAALKALPIEAPRKPARKFAPDEVIYGILLLIGLIKLWGPWMVGFGRPDVSKPSPAPEVEKSAPASDENVVAFPSRGVAAAAASVALASAGPAAALQPFPRTQVDALMSHKTDIKPDSAHSMRDQQSAKTSACDPIFQAGTEKDATGAKVTSLDSPESRARALLALGEKMRAVEKLTGLSYYRVRKIAEELERAA
jgi:hypothetical protein